MNKLSEFFQQEDGYFSAMRLITIVSIFAIIFTWTYVCIVNKKLEDFSPGLVGVIAAFLGAKVWQKYVEQNSTSSTETGLDKLADK